MGNFKRFMSNFWLSLLTYSVICFFGVLCLMLLNVTTRPNIVTDPPRSIPWWAEIILWLHVLGAATLYFYLGTRLKLMSNQLLNFLSVSWSIAFGFLLICLAIFLGPYVPIFGMFSFFRLMIIMADKIDNNYIVLSIVSVLPTIIIWFGMLYKTKKI